MLLLKRMSCIWQGLLQGISKKVRCAQSISMGMQSAPPGLSHAPDIVKRLKGHCLLPLPKGWPRFNIRCIDVQMPVTRVDGLVLSLCGRHLLAICGDKAIREFSVAERLATAHAPAIQSASMGMEVRALMRVGKGLASLFTNEGGMVCWYQRIPCPPLVSQHFMHCIAFTLTCNSTVAT